MRGSTVQDSIRLQELSKQELNFGANDKIKSSVDQLKCGMFQYLYKNLIFINVV